jgi:hypothetical protein
MKWSNVGVAQMYREYGLDLSLVGLDGRVESTVRAADVRRWLPGDHAVEARLPAKAGGYAVVASIGPRGGEASVRLACDAPEVGLRYRLGSVSVK